jgi:pimeloyl-ACP methyl ester carboxylesterase
VDAARRAHNRPAVDEVPRQADGSHVLSLWQMRQPLYPQGDIDLLERFMVDALKAGDLAAEGHRVVGRYVMEARTPRVACPTLVIGATADPHAYPAAAKVAAAIAGSRRLDIPGGMVPLPDQLPAAFADAAGAFLDEVRAGLKPAG